MGLRVSLLGLPSPSLQVQEQCVSPRHGPSFFQDYYQAEGPAGLWGTGVPAALSGPAESPMPNPSAASPDTQHRGWWGPGPRPSVPPGSEPPPQRPSPCWELSLQHQPVLQPLGVADRQQHSHDPSCDWVYGLKTGDGGSMASVDTPPPALTVISPRSRLVWAISGDCFLPTGRTRKRERRKAASCLLPGIPRPRSQARGTAGI